MKRQDPRQPWMNYVDVANIEAILQQATNLGAKIALPKTSVPGVGAFAAIVDAEGNTAVWEQIEN
jgi:predicted enzyme related to lactoylglutathione lyase